MDDLANLPWPEHAEQTFIDFLSRPAHLLLADAAEITRLHRDFAVAVCLAHPDEDGFCLLPTDVLSERMEFWAIVRQHPSFDVEDMVRDVVNQVVAQWRQAEQAERGGR